MNKELDKLFDKAVAYIDGLGYSRSSRGTHVSAWRDFLQWCDARGIAKPSEEDAGAFLAERGWPAFGSCHAASKGRAVLRFVSISKGDGISARRRPEKPLVPDQFRGLHDGYLESLRGRGLAERTVARVGATVRGLLAYLDKLGIADAGSILPRHVLAYAESLNGHATSTRAGDLRRMRAFLSYAEGEIGLDGRLSALFPVICSDVDDVLPSVYSPGEVAAIIAAARNAEGPTAKRDLAFMMLASVVGMRAGDIKGLTFGQVSWSERSVSFSQQKTGKRMALPLTEECLLALADYIANERPASDDEHIFLRSVAPHVPLSEGYSIHCFITAAMDAAGVEARGRHHGSHSLRHSAATNMLSSGATYPVLSGILGHECANTTKRYLRVDVEALRPMCLEVPDA